MISVLRRLGNRRIFAIGSLGLLFVVGLSFFAVSQDVFAIWGVDWVANGFGTVIVGLLFAIIQFVGSLIMSLIYILLVIAKYNSFLSSTAVTHGWSIVRDVANMFFVLVLLAIAIGTILQQQKYHYQTTLPKFIAAAILINFSKTICGLIIDFAQVVMLTFVSSFAATSGGGNFAALLGIPNFLALVGAGGSGQEIVKQATTNDLVIAALLALAFSVIALVVVAVIVMMLVIRIIALWFLIILSPLAFFLTALPERGEQYASQWWEQFINYVVFGPVMAFFLWLSLTVVSVANAGIQDAKDIQLHKELGFDFGEEEGGTGAFLGGNVMQAVGGSVIGTLAGQAGYILGIGMLIMSLVMGQKLGGAAGGVAGGAISNIKDYATGKKGPSPMRWARERAGAIGQKMEQRRKARVEDFAQGFDTRITRPLEKLRENVIGAPTKIGRGLWKMGAESRAGEAVTRLRRNASNRIDTVLERRFGNGLRTPFGNISIAREMLTFGARGKGRRDQAKRERMERAAESQEMNGWNKEIANQIVNPQNQDEASFNEILTQLTTRQQEIQRRATLQRNNAATRRAAGDVNGASIAEDRAEDLERNFDEIQNFREQIDAHMRVLQNEDPASLRGLAVTNRNEAIQRRNRAEAQRTTADGLNAQAQTARQNGDEETAIRREGEMRQLLAEARRNDAQAEDLDRMANTLDGGDGMQQLYEDNRAAAERSRAEAQAARVAGNAAEAARLERQAVELEQRAGAVGGLAGKREIENELQDEARDYIANGDRDSAERSASRAADYRRLMLQDDTNSMAVDARAKANIHDNRAQAHELASTLFSMRDKLPEIGKLATVALGGPSAIPLVYGGDIANAIENSTSTYIANLENATANAVKEASGKLSDESVNKLNEVANDVTEPKIKRMGAMRQILEKNGYAAGEIPRVRQEMVALGADQGTVKQFDVQVKNKYPAETPNATPHDIADMLYRGQITSENIAPASITPQFIQAFEQLASRPEIAGDPARGIPANPERLSTILKNATKDKPAVADAIRNHIRNRMTELQAGNAHLTAGNTAFIPDYERLVNLALETGANANDVLRLNPNGLQDVGFEQAHRNFIENALVNNPSVAARIIARLNPTTLDTTNVGSPDNVVAQAVRSQINDRSRLANLNSASRGLSDREKENWNRMLTNLADPALAHPVRAHADRILR
ncbi:hypothetical protein HY620_01995 [Candidatus Uhrbacteria bacterium]|nr:hypothetical protein [Candidatus Uhrbacteria bacterium]